MVKRMMSHDKRATKRKAPTGLNLRHTIEKAHEGFIHCMSWSPDGETLATASEDGTIRFWDVETGELYRTLFRHFDKVTCISWSPDGHTFASGSEDKSIIFWDLDSSLIFRQSREHSSSVHSIDWSPEGKLIASGSGDGYIMLWKTENWRPSWMFRAHSAKVTSLAWSPDGLTLASGSSSETETCLWSTENQKPRWKLGDRTTHITSLCWSPNNKTIVLGSGDNDIRIFDANKRREIRRLKGHKGAIISVSFSSDGSLLASKSLDGSIRIWNSFSWEEMIQLKETSSNCCGLAFNPREPVLATVDHEQKTIRIWDIDQYALFGAEWRSLSTQSIADKELLSVTEEMQTRRFSSWAGSSQVTLALVFTDILSFTVLNNQLGNEAMSEVRAAHFNQAKKFIEKYEGYEIKTIGDSVFVAFRTAVNALNFALELYVNTGHSLVKIRAGIHVGPVQIEKGDAFGSTVNYTSRVVSLAKNDEIFVSERAKADIEAHKPQAYQSLEWVEQTDCEMKGFPSKQKLWCVRAVS